MTGRVIGLDVDGVLADFTRAFRVIANDLYGVPVHGSGGQPTWHPHDLTAEQDQQVWRVIDGKPRFWHNLDPIITPGEIADLNAIVRGEDEEVVYVTARHDRAAVATGYWLRANGLPPGDVIHAGDKVPVLNDTPRLRGFLDDSPHGVTKMRAAGLPVFVRDWPYNRHVEAARVGSVGEYIAALTL